MKINNIKYNGSINIVAYLVLNNKNKFFGNEANLYNINKTLKEELISKTNNLKEELNAAQEAIDFLIQIGGNV